MPTTMKLIAKTTLGADAVNFGFTSIPATHTDLLVVLSNRTTRSAVNDALLLRFNSDSGTTVYSNRNLNGTGAAAQSSSDFFRSSGFLYIGEGCGDTATASTFGSTEIYIPNYAGSTNKSVSVTGASENNGTTAFINAIAGLWASTAAINAVTFFAQFGSYKTGTSAYLYGITRA